MYIKRQIEGNRSYCNHLACSNNVITPPARRAWRSYKIRPVSVFFSFFPRFFLFSRFTFPRQQGCTCKDSHPKCFITTNTSSKLSPGAVNRGEVLRACFRHALHTKVNSNTVCDYYDFVTDYRFLYDNCSISFSPRSEKITSQSRRDP